MKLRAKIYQSTTKVTLPCSVEGNILWLPNISSDIILGTPTQYYLVSIVNLLSWLNASIPKWDKISTRQNTYANVKRSLQHTYVRTYYVNSKYIPVC